MANSQTLKLLQILRFIAILSALIAPTLAFDKASSEDRSPESAGSAAAEAEPISGDSQAVGSPYSLADCVTLALHHNQRLLSNKEEIEAAYGVQLQSRSRFLPALDLFGSYAREDQDKLPNSGTFQFGRDESWSYGVEASVNVFSGGRDYARWRESNARSEAAKLLFDAAVQDTVLEVRTRFYDAVVAQMRREVQRQSLDLLDEELRQERARFEAGTTANFNLLRSEVEVANARAPLIRSENFIRNSLTELARSIGVSQSALGGGAADFEIKGELEFRVVSLDLAALLNRAMLRSEVRALEFQREASEHGVSASRAEYLPAIDLYAQYSWDRSPFRGSAEDVYEGWESGVRSRWNLFAGGATSGRIIEARARLRQAALSLAEIKLRIDSDLRRAYSAVQEALELVKASEKVTEQAEEGYRMATTRFKAGVAPQIEKLDAQVALTQARLNRVEALYSFNLALAQLERAVGGAL